MLSTPLKRSTLSLIKRQLHTSKVSNKAAFFDMPAMSPTMTEGGIVEWKFKAGDKFSAGDVLVEVETDKATIDVEAQDDGIMAKVIIENGAKNIPVGKPIAILAEPEDDLSTLELPQVPTAAAAPAKKAETPAPAPAPAPAKKATTPAPAPAKKATTPAAAGTFNKADPKQTLYPSVASLLHANHISTETALNEIQASGPQGKILKGDVLAYLGKISKDNLTKVTEYINKGTKLDLSNIELRAPAPKEDASASAAAALKAVKKEPVVLRETFQLPLLNESVSEADLKYIISKKIEELVQFSHSKQEVHSQYYDSLFEDLIAVEPLSPRFSVSWELLVSGSSSQILKDSLFDILVSNKVSSSAAKSTKVAHQPIEYGFEVSVQVSDKYADASEKAQIFLAGLEDFVQAINEA